MNERKILVVDDEAPIREMLVKAFGKAGYAVRAVSSGEEALKIFFANQLNWMHFISPSMTLLKR
jgi:CheY-like chemotaxis protein